MKLVWITDPHLDHPGGEVLRQLFSSINEAKPDALAITGDIAAGNTIQDYLDLIHTNVGQLNDGRIVPIYFVLGNHDYYNSSIKQVRQKIRTISKDSTNDLYWMNVSGVIELTDDTAIIGHDGWADGRNGNWDKSNVLLNDYFFIEELTSSSRFGEDLSRRARKTRIEDLADEAANYLEKQAEKALKKYKHIIVLTHFPPFKEACWHEGQLSDDNWLPHFSNAVVGPRMAQLMIQHPEKKMTILCGHSHSDGIYNPLDNLTVKTGRAIYGAPAIQEIIEVD